MGWMMVWWILIPVLVAALAWGLVKGASRPNASSESPEDILRRRYARGELDEETFQRMRDELRR